MSAVNKQPLEHRRCYQSLVLLFKYIEGNGPNYDNLRNSDHNHPIIIDIIKLVSLTRLRICGISFLLTLRDRLSWKFLTAAVLCQSAQKSVYQLVLSHSAANVLKICFPFPYCCSHPVVVSVEAPGIRKGLALVVSNYFQAIKAHFLIFFESCSVKSFVIVIITSVFKCLSFSCYSTVQNMRARLQHLAATCGTLELEPATRLDLNLLRWCRKVFRMMVDISWRVK